MERSKTARGSQDEAKAAEHAEQLARGREFMERYSETFKALAKGPGADEPVTNSRK